VQVCLGHDRDVLARLMGRLGFHGSRIPFDLSMYRGFAWGLLGLRGLRSCGIAAMKLFQCALGLLVVVLVR
jgi:hypothetical protein